MAYRAGRRRRWGSAVVSVVGLIVSTRTARAISTEKLAFDRDQAAQKLAFDERLAEHKFNSTSNCRCINWPLTLPSLNGRFNWTQRTPIANGGKTSRSRFSLVSIKCVSPFGQSVPCWAIKMKRTPVRKSNMNRPKWLA
jgi:hypothetical protein